MQRGLARTVDGQAKTGRRVAVPGRTDLAQVDIQIFSFDRPVARQRIFEACACGPTDFGLTYGVADIVEAKAHGAHDGLRES